jgi:pyridoxal phosphate enzyme (YggS family)
VSAGLAHGEAKQRLAAIRTRIATACTKVGRSPEDVILVGASKMQGPALLGAFVAAGLGVLGENRVQEAAGKQELLPPGVDWHLIGPLQSNKARVAVRLFSTFHAIDRVKIAQVLDEEAARAGRRPLGFLEINLGSESSKHGFTPEGLPEAVRPLADLEHLRIAGLMAIPPPADEPEQARPWFVRLRELRDELGSRLEWSGFPGELSMGMSDDFEVAIEEGATLVRVGTALFGARSSAAPTS